MIAQSFDVLRLWKFVSFSRCAKVRRRCFYFCAILFFFSYLIYSTYMMYLLSAEFFAKNVDFVSQIGRFWYKVTNISQILSVYVQNPQIESFCIICETWLAICGVSSLKSRQLPPNVAEYTPRGTCLNSPLTAISAYHSDTDNAIAVNFPVAHPVRKPFCRHWWLDINGHHATLPPSPSLWWWRFW
jgi:hypothetical protein